MVGDVLAAKAAAANHPPLEFTPVIHVVPQLHGIPAASRRSVPVNDHLKPRDHSPSTDSPGTLIRQLRSCFCDSSCVRVSMTSHRETERLSPRTVSNGSIVRHSKGGSNTSIVFTDEEKARPVAFPVRRRRSDDRARAKRGAYLYGWKSGARNKRTSPATRLGFTRLEETFAGGMRASRDQSLSVARP